MLQIIIFGFAIAMILLITDSLSATPKRIKKKNAYINYYNSLVECMAKINSEYSFTAEKLRSRIALSNDDYAREQFLYVVDEYKKLERDVLDKLWQIKKTVMTNDPKAEEMMKSINMDFCKLTDIIHKFDNIKINTAKSKPKETQMVIKTNEYFSDCDTKDKLIKRYKALCKVFHPDNQAGNADIYMHIKEEYEDKLKRIGDDNE